MSGIFGLLFLALLGVLFSAFEIVALGIVGLVEFSRAVRAKRRMKKGRA